MTGTVGPSWEKQVDIWTHFKYNATERKGECVVLSGEDPCGYKIAGKKTTNLKRHLQANHTET